jgi:hypothetical protein
MDTKGDHEPQIDTSQHPGFPVRERLKNVFELEFSHLLASFFLERGNDNAAFVFCEEFRGLGIL